MLGGKKKTQTPKNTKQTNRTPKSETRDDAESEKAQLRSPKYDLPVR